MVYIHNTTHIEIKDFKEAMSTYERGLQYRKVSSTDMNLMSSRSHLIYSIIVDTFNVDTN
jgi:hypothetical protein